MEPTGKLNKTYRVDPEPSAVTPILRTRRHPCGDLEVRKPRPHTRLVDAKDGEILGLDLRHVTLICDRERAAFQIVEPVGMHSRIGERSVVVSGARVVAFLEVKPAIFGLRGEERCMRFVTCEFRGGSLAYGQFEEISRIGRIVEVSVEPPLVEGHVLKRRHGTVVIVGDVLTIRVGPVEAVHAGVEHSYQTTY